MQVKEKTTLRGDAPKMGVWENNSQTKVAEVTFEGKTYNALINNSDSPVLLAGGYNTTANGRADDIEILPNEGIIQTEKGSGWSFAKYVVFDV